MKLDQSIYLAANAQDWTCLVHGDVFLTVLKAGHFKMKVPGHEIWKSLASVPQKASCWWLSQRRWGTWLHVVEGIQSLRGKKKKKMGSLTLQEWLKIILMPETYFEVHIIWALYIPGEIFSCLIVVIIHEFIFMTLIPLLRSQRSQILIPCLWLGLGKVPRVKS